MELFNSIGGIMKEKDVKCYIVNKDVSLFEYEILEGVKTFQVEICGESKKRYVIGNFSTKKKAIEYIKRIGCDI